MILPPLTVRSLLAAADTPKEGVIAVLISLGVENISPEDLDEVADALLSAATDAEPYVQLLRHPLEYVQNERQRGVVEWELRERVLRSLLREGKVFAAQPVITVHTIDPANDPGLSPGPALTEEQIAALPRETWAEVRLTVLARRLPDAETAAVPR